MYMNTCISGEANDCEQTTVTIKNESKLIIFLQIDITCRALGHSNKIPSFLLPAHMVVTSLFIIVVLH